MKEEARHLQVVDCQVLRGDPVNNGLWPFDASDNGVNVLGAGEPYAAGTIFAGVAVAEEGRLAWDELLTLDWVVAEELEKGAEVQKGPKLG